MILVVLTIHFFEFVYIYLLHNYHLPITTSHLTFTKPFPRLENNYCFFSDYCKEFNCQEINYNACIFIIKTLYLSNYLFILQKCNFTQLRNSRKMVNEYSLFLR